MNCVEACPKGLNPTRAIGKIKELLELDLILAQFLERPFDRLDGGQRKLFTEMLDVPDNDLLDWALGRGEPPDPRYRPVVELLRAG